MRISLCSLVIISLFLLSCAHTSGHRHLPKRAVQHIRKKKVDALRLYVKDGDWLDLTKPQLANVLTMHKIPHTWKFHVLNAESQRLMHDEVGVAYDEVLWIPFGYYRLVTICCRSGIIVRASESQIPE